jgi:hypothetical protein
VSRWGGKRAGAGRPKGTGSPLRALRVERAADRAAARDTLRELLSGEDDPARLVLGIAKDPAIDPRLRLEAGIALLPFVHPKLSYAEVDARHVTMTVPAEQLVADLDARIRRFAPTEEQPAIEAQAEPE